MKTTANNTDVLECYKMVQKSDGILKKTKSTMKLQQKLVLFLIIEKSMITKNFKIPSILGVVLLLGSSLKLYGQTITSVSLQGAKPTGSNTWEVDYINGANSIIEKEVIIGYSNHVNNKTGNGNDYMYYTQAGTSNCWEVLQGGSGSNSWKTLPFCEDANGVDPSDPTKGNHVTYFRYNTGKTGCNTTGSYTETLSLGWSVFSGGSCSGFKTGTTVLELEVTVQITSDNLYTWSEPTSGIDSSYKIAGNWTPTRTTPSSNDILVVDLAQSTMRNTTIYMDGVNDNIDQFIIYPNNHVTFKCSTSTNSGTWNVGKATSSSGDDFRLDSLGGMRFNGGTLDLSLSSGNSGIFRSKLDMVAGTLNLNGPGTFKHTADINVGGGTLKYNSSAITTLELAGKNTKLSGTGGTLYIDSTVNVIIGNGTTSTFTLERILPIISDLSLKANTTLASNAPTSYTSVSDINSWTPFLQLKATPKSNSSAHGQLLELPATSTVTGGAQFEIYNNKQRAYRAFGIPLSGGTMIPQFTDDIDVTGTVTGSNANDFTTSCSWCTHSIFQWNETTSAWSPYSSGNSVTTIPVATGILTFFRGARGNGLGDTTVTANEEVLDFKGELSEERLNVTLSNAGTGSLKGYNLVGNPYPCAIDLRMVYESNKSKILPRFYLYDAIARRYNEYDSISTNGNAVTPTKNGTSKFVSPGNGSKRLSQILDAGGAAFMIVNPNSSNSSETITLFETHKSNGFKSATKHFSSGVQEENTYPCDQLRGELSYQDKNYTESDGFTIEFDRDGISSDADLFDMNKLYAGYMGCGTLTANNTWLSIDRRGKIAETGETKSIPLKVAYPKEGPANMELSFNFCSEGNPSYKIQLFDKKNNSATEISSGTVYPYTASNTDEKKSDRFELLFTGIEKQNSTNTIAAPVFSVFPNPSEDGIFHILNNSQAVTTECQVYNLNGKLIKVISLNGNDTIESIDLKSLESGMYILNIISNKNTQSSKIQIQ